MTVEPFDANFAVPTGLHDLHHWIGSLSQLFHRSGRWLLPQAKRMAWKGWPWELDMQNDTAELDRMQSAYKAAVEEWIAAIKHEEALASVNHSIAEVDQWEGAHFKEDEIRSKVKAAKKQYEDAIRKKFYNF